MTLRRRVNWTVRLRGKRSGSRSADGIQEKEGGFD